MATTDKFRIIHSEKRIRSVDELGMKHNLNPIMSVVKQLPVAQMGQYRILLIVDHVVGDNRRQIGVAAGVQQSLEDNYLVWIQYIIRRGMS